MQVNEYDDICWDPLQDQLNLNQPISHDALVSGGYSPLAIDRDSVPGRLQINIYVSEKTRNRWVMTLVDSNGRIIASALVYSSSALGLVVREFQAIAGGVA